MDLKSSSKPEKIEIRDGALVILSGIPITCLPSRATTGSDSVWTYKLLVARPNKRYPFMLTAHNGVYMKGIPRYVKHKTGGIGIWHIDPDVRVKFKARGYLFVPGGFIREEKLPRIFTLKDAFVPDEKDSNQQLEEVMVYAGDDSFDYADHPSSIRRACHTSTGKNLAGCVYSYISELESSQFGYSCEHSGGAGLSSNMHAKFKPDKEQLIETARVIIADLEKKLRLPHSN